MNEKLKKISQLELAIFDIEIKRLTIDELRELLSICDGDKAVLVNNRIAYLEVYDAIDDSIDDTIDDALRNNGGPGNHWPAP